MTWLVLGVLLWVGAHLFKRVLPKQRDALGKWGRPLVAVVIVVSIVLMIIGQPALLTRFAHETRS